MTHKNRVLVFSEFPFDFKWTPPMRVGPGIWAFEPSKHRVRPLTGESDADYRKRASAVVAAVSPFHGLGGGHVHFALRTDGEALASDAQAEQSLFEFLAALRLWKPLRMQIDGSYEVDDDGESIGVNLRMYRQVTPEVPQLVAAVPEAARRCSTRDLRVGRALAARIRSLNDSQDLRLLNAWTGFAQATLGTIGSAQMTTVALFGVLDTLLTPGSANSASLGRRADRTLSERLLRFRTEEWIRAHYERLRDSYAHGNMLAHARGERLHGEAARAIPIIHELARLCLLRWLVQSRDWRTRHQSLKGPRAKQLDHVRYERSVLWNSAPSVLDLHPGQLNFDHSGSLNKRVSAPSSGA